MAAGSRFPFYTAARLSSRGTLPRLGEATFFAGAESQRSAGAFAKTLQRPFLRAPSTQLFPVGNRLGVSSARVLVANAMEPRRFFAAAASAKATHALQPTGTGSVAFTRPGQGSNAQFQTSLADKTRGLLGVGFLRPTKMASFAATFLLNFRFYFMYMARTTFQAVRPLLAFSVFGEVMKLVLATMSSGLFSFLFSFVLAFEVFYFFLQCYISYTFLTMFFTVLF
ncbi:putative transmembrane protein [Toxoplasma gondii p89]|uniref:Putative transmembrane protein n=2 Tax=Toxoplasma gondii TaxID=5811 RepID=A0A3R8B6S6_TOXGO|nr:putative transmembrane protein [Toxoplasma gondii p89]RQX72403.1 putative transmembrane protein [Toxoplasma gondii CAST]